MFKSSNSLVNGLRKEWIIWAKLFCEEIRQTQGCKWSQKKKKRKSTTWQWNLKIMQPSLQYLIVCPYYKYTFDCWLYYLPTILAYYKSGWQCLLGAYRDLFLTTLAKGSRAVSESECTWLSIIISQMLWLLMHCLVFRYSRKFGLWWLLWINWIMHPFGSSLHVIQHNSQETGREILISRSRIYLTLRDRDYRSRSIWSRFN